jgi:hypothetical protein
MKPTFFCISSGVDEPSSMTRSASMGRFNFPNSNYAEETKNRKFSSFLFPVCFLRNSPHNTADLKKRAQAAGCFNKT